MNGSDSDAGELQPQDAVVGVIDPDDPLLIAQTLTYITDDGSVVLSFSSAPFSFAFKLRFILLEAIFVLLLVAAVPIGAHGTVVAISIVNLVAVAWFWYNLVRSVEVTSDGGLRFWIGNVEMDVPFSKILSIKRVAGECALVSLPLLPHRGFLSCPTDGVAVVTSVPSTPFFLWPRSAGKPERRLGPFSCPRLVVVFSPAGGGMNFIREVENEMKNFQGEGGDRKANQQYVQPPAFLSGGDHVGQSSQGVAGNNVQSQTGDFFDV
uniref:Uncharacterized protein n=1 Tax=Helicotheca tamesis TaxID=374047 RepID=A0A7S2GTB7_9STRA|mmetsp:Transcript_11884/g.16423  ORF Transcript_11884/g.16423 Transcript_11884/m.16423 type:complete len:265 (+) Transcript_11884:62-856(+)